METFCLLPIAISAVLCALGVFFGPAVLLARFTKMHGSVIVAMSTAIVALVYFAAYLVWKKPLADVLIGPICWFAIMLPINAVIVWGVRRLSGWHGKAE